MKWIKVVRFGTLFPLTHKAVSTLTVAEAQKLAAARLLCCAACGRRFKQDELFVPDTDGLILLCGPHKRSCQVPVTYQRASAVLPSLASQLERAAFEAEQGEREATGKFFPVTVLKNRPEASTPIFVGTEKLRTTTDAIRATHPCSVPTGNRRPIHRSYADMLAADAARAAKHTDTRQSA